MYQSIERITLKHRVILLISNICSRRCSKVLYTLYTYVIYIHSIPYVLRSQPRRPPAGPPAAL